MTIEEELQIELKPIMKTVKYYAEHFDSTDIRKAKLIAIEKLLQEVLLVDILGQR